MISASVAALGGSLLALEATNNEVSELRLLVLPLIGSVILSFAMILLNPKTEVRRIVVGRSMFALFFGASLPSVIGLFHPSLRDVLVHPTLLLLSGGSISGLVYVLSWPVVKKFYARSDTMADTVLLRIESKLKGPSSLGDS